MVRRRWTRDIREVVIAERELPRVRKVRRDIRLRVLLANRLLGAREPSLMIVRRRDGWRIARVGQGRISVRAGKPSEIVIEGVILLEDDDHVFYGSLGSHF